MDKTTPEKILNVLVDKYEMSSISRNKSERNLKVRLEIQKYDPLYFDTTHFEYYRRYEDSFKLLSSMQFIEVLREGNFAMYVILCHERIEAIYTWLNRPSIHKLRNEIRHYLQEQQEEPNLDNICGYLLERELNHDSNKQYFKDIDELKEIFSALKYLVEPRNQELSVRQVSQHIFGNSKRFENLQSRIVKLLRTVDETFLDLSDDMILESYGIVKNPTYIFLKGVLDMSIGQQFICLEELVGGIGLSSEVIHNIEIGHRRPKYLITIENLDTYHKAIVKNGIAIYLSGFHNTAKQSLLKRIFMAFPDIEYYHFGDIDVGGFLIYQNLIQKTGIAFKPLLMNSETLMKYSNHTRSLTEFDQSKLKKIDIPVFNKVIQVMLDNNIKLEQEIIDSTEVIRKLESA